MTQLNMVDGHIDRIAIVGNMERNREHVPLVKYLSDPRYIHFRGGYIHNNYRYNTQVGFATQDSQVTVQFNTLKVMDGSDFRLDFNPAKCNAEDMRIIREILSMVKDKRYTQVDLCLNFHQDLSEYKVTDGRRRKGNLHHGYDGEPETYYRRTRNSDDYLKFYNKVAEQKNNKDREIDHDWWRIEQTITAHLAERFEEWEWFKGVKLIKDKDMPIFPEGTDPKDESVAFAIHMGFKRPSDFKKDYRRKIKKLLENATYGEEFDVYEAIKKTPIVSQTNEVLKELLSN